MDEVNKALARAIKEKGMSKAEIARQMGGKISGQSIGYYENGRKIPHQFLMRWKEVFGESLIPSETIVSRETKRFETLSVREDVWDEIKRNNETFRKAMDSLLATVDKTMENLSKAR